MASVALVGYDATSGTWSNVSRHDEAFVGDLDGELTTSLEARDSASRDQGRELCKVPAAVLRPGSAADVSRVLERCQQFGISVAAQGAKHATGGHGLVDGGLVVDMTALNQAGEVNLEEGYIDVQAGIMWSHLAALLASQNLQFAGGHTGYLMLTVGGTLNVGGISDMPHKGAQVDAVIGLEVVTGRGDIVWCSDTENSELFNAALAGLGQVGIITRARLALEAAPETVRSVVVPYTDSRNALRAARTAISTGNLNKVFIMVTPPSEDGLATFNLHLTSYGAADGSALNDLLDHLPEWSDAPGTSAHAGSPERRPRGSVQSLVTGFRDHLEQFTRLIDQWRDIDGWDDRIKPWFDAFISDQAVDGFINETLPEMTDEDWSLPHGQGFVLLFPHRTGSFTRPRLRLPDGPQSGLSWLVDVLNVSGPNPDEGYGARMRKRNELWMRRARKSGGKWYPIGGVGYSQQDWREHYGDTWSDVERAKLQFDPRGILTPGTRIFGDL